MSRKLYIQFSESGCFWHDYISLLEHYPVGDAANLRTMHEIACLEPNAAAWMGMPAPIAMKAGAPTMPLSAGALSKLAHRTMFDILTIEGLPHTVRDISLHHVWKFAQIDRFLLSDPCYAETT